MNHYELQAITALRAWHSVAAAEFPANMQLSFDEFLAYIRLKPDFLLSFGKSVVDTANLSGVGMPGVIRSMEELARQSQGRVSQFHDGYPKLSEFFEALIGRALQWDVKVIGTVAKDITVKGLEAAASAGKTFLQGYGLILALSAGAGLFLVISSWKKKG